MVVSFDAKLDRDGFWPTKGQSALRFTGSVSVSVTGTLAGEPVAPVAVIVSSPLSVPVASPEMSMLTLSALGAVPFAGATVSHDWLLAEVNVRVPLPVLLIFKLSGAGFAPPVVA